MVQAEFPFRSSGGSPRLLHGGDYNPEQWLDQPEILEQDAALMVEARVNVASIGIFAWAALEPNPGEFDFAWLDQTLERLHSRAVGVILATPSAARPRWLAEMHPGVMRVRRDGQRLSPAVARHNHCLSSPEFRERVALIDGKLAERYREHPALLGFHVSNEFGGDEDAARCYCARCVAGFQSWLKRRYHDDLDALNRAWWTSFWSHTYGEWTQIRPGDDSIEALGLNWRRYQSSLVSDFCALEIAALRRHSAAPVTTNMHGDLTHYDHGELARCLDFTSYDSYPDIVGSSGDRAQLHEHCWMADAVRSFLPGRTWLLMESCPSQPQWKALPRLKRPGVHRALSLAMVAHGSDGVCYFQWRAGRGGMEKLHGAVLMQDAPHDTRVFREVRALGRELEVLAPVAGASVPAAAAVLWDVHSEWARSLNSGLWHLPTPRRASLDWHLPLWNAGIGVDVPDASANLDGYRLVIVPGVFLLRPGFTARLEAAALAGAQVLVDGLSAWVDDDFGCVAGGRPGPLRTSLGLQAEELDVLRDDERVPLHDEHGWFGAGASARTFIDHVHADDCEVLVRAATGFHEGWPVLTRKALGRGALFYLAAGIDEASRAELALRLCAEAAIAPVLPVLPVGIVARERLRDDRAFLFLFNPNPEPREVSLGGKSFADAVTGAAAPPVLRLEAWETRVLTRPR